MHLACWFCFVNPSLQYCYKEHIRRSSMHGHASRMLVVLSTHPCNVAAKKTSEEHHASSMLVVFCKPILAMLLQRKHQAIINASRMLVVVCKPILAMLLQRKHQKSIMHLACWLCFVNPSLQYCYKENIRRSSMHSHASRMLVVFCKPNLAMLLQRKHQKSIMHLACWLCFVNPSLQCCYKENIRRASCI